MLIVVMHNKRNYLEALVTLIREKGILDTTIVEHNNLGVRIFGSKSSFTFHKGSLSNVYDKAFMAVIKDEKKVQELLDLIENDNYLNALNSDDKGFICAVPFNEVNFLGEEVNKHQQEKFNIKLSEYLKKDRIILDLKSTEKEDSINEIASCLKNADDVKDFDTLIKKIFQREELFTTGIGYEIAIPHARTNAVSDFVIAVGKSKQGVDFNSLDKIPVKLIFLFAVPEKENRYVKYLARLNRILKEDSFRTSLQNAETEEEIISLFQMKEKEY